MEQKQKQIAVKFTVMHDDATGFTCLMDDHTSGCSTYAQSLDAGAKKIRPLLETKVREALEWQEAPHTITVIQCNDGTVLIVRFSLGTWGYDTARENNRHGCSGCWGIKSRDQAIQRARDHAEQSYGGIAWQCGYGAHLAQMPQK